MNPVEEVFALFRERGGSEYGGEAVTQAEHALQTAALARSSGADAALVAAALLHDVGHLLHDLPDDAPEGGVDDLHERIGAEWLCARFVDAVSEPVRLHVAAKRWLCGAEPAYYETLSGPSRLSLQLQGGPMAASERRTFESSPHFEAAVRLRRWDDEAKVVDFDEPPIESFEAELRASFRSSDAG